MSDYMRENLLITAGVRAGYLDRCGYIDLPSGVDGEDEVADFIIEMVNEYTESGREMEPFDLFIECRIMERFEHKYDPTFWGVRV